MGVTRDLAAAIIHGPNGARSAALRTGVAPVVSIRPASPLALAILTFLQSAPSAAATFTVDTTLNSNSAFVSACTSAPADCSFWGALLAADATQAEDTLVFAIPANQDSGCVASTGICRIETPLANLVVSWPIVIDGLSQAGATANTLSANGNGVDMNLKIELVRPPGATQNGLNFQRAVTLRGLSVSRNPAQQSQQGALISFNNAGGDQVYRIESCIVGGRANGSTEPAPQQNLFAFQLGQCPSFTVGPWTSVIHVGGVLPEQRNWLLTGGPALQIDGCESGTPPNQLDVRVEGNLFGTSKNGLQQLVPNQATAFDWIRGGVGNGANLRIGGANSAMRNVFMRAASKTLGMTLSSASATSVTVQGNYFGVAVDGMTPFLLPSLLPSNLLSPVLEVSRARIGGTGPGEGNLFVAHEATSVIQVSGRAGVLGNTFIGNTGFQMIQDSAARFSNGRLNDPGDADAGPLQNWPQISAFSVAGGMLTLSYKVDSLPANSSYPLTVEFFRGITNNPGVLLGRDTYIAAEANQVKTITLSLPAGVNLTAEDLILATANMANDQGVSELNWAPVLLSFIGNTPAAVGQSTPITVRLQGLGPFRPRGQVILSDGLLSNPAVQRCTATLSPSVAGPFIAEGSCNFNWSTAGTRMLQAEYLDSFMPFHNEQGNTPTASRSIDVIVVVNALFCDGFESPAVCRGR